MPKLKLAKVLDRKKLSKRQFAIRLGIDYTAVFRFFRPKYDPKFSMLARWAKALGCRIADLYDE